MALLFVDGFDHTSESYRFMKWDWSNYESRIQYADGYGRGGGWGLRMLEDDFMYRQIPIDESTIILGVAIKFGNQPTDVPIAFMDGDTIQVCFKFLSDGSVQVLRNATILGTSAAGTYTVETWQYFETKIHFDSTVGTVEVRINGSSILSLTGQNTMETSNAYATDLRLGGTYESYFDDLYFSNILGTENNDFLGDIKITTLHPTSDGNSSDFTPSTGTDHYALVDESQLTDITADNNKSSTVGDKELYGLSTFDKEGTIFGVQVTAVVTNTDAGAITVKPLSRSGGTPADNEGDEFYVAPNVKAAMHIFEQEPTDSVDWTAAKINAAEFGLKVES